jgi:hypothetical protein
MPSAWAEGRALLGSNSSAVPGAKTAWGGTMPPSTMRERHPGDQSRGQGTAPAASRTGHSGPRFRWPFFPHAAASARHSAYVVRWRSMCQMIVASFRITATRAMMAPLRRLMRLNHSRSQASFRSTLCVTCPSNHRAMPLPASERLPSRWLFSPLLRQPGVSPSSWPGCARGGSARRGRHGRPAKWR